MIRIEVPFDNKITFHVQLKGGHLKDKYNVWKFNLFNDSISCLAQMGTLLCKIEWYLFFLRLFLSNNLTDSIFCLQ